MWTGHIIDFIQIYFKNDSTQNKSRSSEPLLCITNYLLECCTVCHKMINWANKQLTAIYYMTVGPKMNMNKDEGIANSASIL